MQERKVTAEQVALWAREATLEYQADLARLQYMADSINALRAGDLAMIESLSEKVATMSGHLGRLAEKEAARTPLPTVDDEMETCGNCRFWHTEVERCRRYPPVFIAAYNEEVDGYQDAGWQPITPKDGWCGEWRACGPKGGAA